MTAEEFIQKNRSTLIKAGSALVVLLVIGLVVYIIASWLQGISNEAAQRQNDLITAQARVQTQLSTCLDSGRTAAKVTQKEFDSVKDVLVSTAEARYQNEGALSGDAFIQVISENNPTIDQSSWRRLVDIMVGCRKDVRDDQNELQRLSNEFKTWTETGDVFTSKVRNNYPDDRLVAFDVLQKKKITGQDALDYLNRIITTEEATNAIGSGVMPDQSDDLFGEDK